MSHEGPLDVSIGLDKPGSHAIVSPSERGMQGRVSWLQRVFRAVSPAAVRNVVTGSRRGIMNRVLQDLYGHQAWADAEHWRAMAAHAPAREDQALHHRLHHLHLVQRSFIWAVGDRTATFAFSKADDFKTFDDLKAFARDSHAIINQFVEGVTDTQLAQNVSIPWFKDPPLTITVGEALTQCAMHSQWHRGQNATRLRELGATPPTVD